MIPMAVPYAGTLPYPLSSTFYYPTINIRGAGRERPGKVLRSIFLFISIISTTLFLSGSPGELHVTNSMGIPLKSISMQTPFIVTVTLRDADAARSWPTVEGLEHFKVVGQQSGENISMVQGQQTRERRFQYTVIADIPGEFTLGPAKMGSQDLAGAYSISVLDAIPQKKESYSVPRYQIVIPKKKWVAGEKIPLILRFVYQDPAITLTHIEKPHTPGLTIHDLDEEAAYDEVIKNEMFHIIEYKGRMYADQPGNFVLRSLLAEYTEPNTARTGWAFFGFSTLRQKKAAASDAVVLTIDSLPLNAQQIEAIGTFSSFTATLQQAQVPLGEAVTLTLALTGEGNFEKIDPPVLALPQELRAYESKMSEAPTLGKGTQKWEYVIQGLKEGNYTIKEQPFSFFDTESRKVKMLKTKPLSLKITAPIKKVINETIPEEPKQSVIPELEKMILTDETTKPAIPLPAFLVLFFLAPAFALIRFFGRTHFAALQTLYKKIRIFWIVHTTLKSIKKACAKADMSHLHALMAQALKACYSLEEGMKLSDVKHALIEKGWSLEDIDAWDEFMQQLLNYSSFRSPRQTVATADNKMLCAHAEEWLKKMKRCAS